MFSRIRSKATIVSLIEYPIIDKIAAIKIDDTSNLNMLKKAIPAVN